MRNSRTVSTGIAVESTPSAAPATKEVEIVFVPHTEKPETKNCFRFDEVPENGMPARIGQLYVQKWALGNRLPERFTLKLVVPV
ncbi:MAG: hypothetical protein WCF84_04415 [Anaerolineae bacterium]